MKEYKKYELVYYKIEDEFIKEYMLFVDVEELLSSDIYLALMNCPKYANKFNIEHGIVENDTSFFSIEHNFVEGDFFTPIEYRNRYDIINLKTKRIPACLYKTITLPGSGSDIEPNVDDVYEIEYDQLNYVRVWTLVTGLLNYIGEIDRMNMIDNYELYVSKIDTINEIISKLLMQLKDNPNPEIKEIYNRVEYSLDNRLIRQANLNDQAAVEDFFSKNKKNDKSVLNIKKRILRQS